MADTEDASNATYRGQLVDAYLKRAGGFRKLFTTLLGFTAAFGFFIAWPYLAAVQQEQQLSRDIQRIDAELKQLATRHARYQQPRRAVQVLTGMIDKGPHMLRDYIGALSNDTPFAYPDSAPTCAPLMDPPQMQPDRPVSADSLALQMQQQIAQEFTRPQAGDRGAMQQRPPDSCAGLDGQKRLVCRIDRFVQFQLCGYEQAFRYQILPALATLQDGGQALFDQAQLDRQFADISGALQRHVADNPTFWRTFQGKGDLGVKLQEEVERLWNDLARRIEPVAKDLQQRIKQAGQRQTALQAESKALAAQRQALEQRLAKIQSPIGNLPIGLAESVLLFPVVLAIGFGMATASLLEQLRLRRTLRKSEQGGSGGDILNSDELAAVAPLWIEPASPVPYKLLRWLLLITPLLAFGGTVIAIATAVGQDGAALLTLAPAHDWIYWLLYTGSAVALIVSLWLMYQGLLRLQRSSPGASAG